MISGSHYREEARRCRVRAARDPDSASSARWLQLASEYELLADDLDASPPSPVADRRVRLQGSQQHHGREESQQGGLRVAAAAPFPAPPIPGRKTPATD